MRVNRHAAGVLWVLLYVVLVTSPLVLMALRPTPPARPFLVEVSIALGFVGIVMIALQFVLIGRFQALTAPFGIDALLRYHRHIAGLALAFVIAHPVILVIHDPAMLTWLNPIAGDWASRTGNWSLYALVLLTLLSIFRKQFRLSYEAWRATHAFLGISAIVLAHLHITLAGRYTDAFWKEAVLIVVTVVAVGLYAYVRLVKPALYGRTPYKVAEVVPERGNVWSLVLEADGHPGLEFLPGQYAYLKLGSPRSPEEHPFSLSSSSERPERIEFAIKELGDFTNEIGKVPAGTPAFVDGPHGSFSIDLDEAPGYVLIAGGIGIAPFMSIIRTMADRGDPRPVLLIYGEKEWDQVAFREELESLRERMPLQVVYTLDNPPEGWEGETGFVDEDFLRRNLPREGFERQVLICGPNPMIDAVERALARCGIPERNITAERFELV